MCAIGGYKNLSSSQFVIDQEHAHVMQQSMRHRGPDGFGIWYSNKQETVLVHRRLSIVDLSDAGAQPMQDSEQTVVISFNGEIYNHKELRTELESLGYIYKSQTDTETILYAYKQWGIECIAKFDGMFAFVLFDIQKNELFLVRDRIGIKPLYFTLQSGILSFASELKALWQLPWITKTINHLSLYHYLSYLAAPAPLTLYKGMYKLPAGFYLKVDVQQNITFTQWYFLANKVAPIITDETEAAQTVLQLLRNSVQKRMMADVPVGVFLSGGIDSSLNVALMAECQANLKTFNVSFSDGPELTEQYWARKVAKLYNTDHHEITISEQDAYKAFCKIVYHQDEPLGDSVCVPLYFVAQLAKQQGVAVVQIGEGSDELFCGYPLYAQYLNLEIYWNTQNYIPNFIKKGLFITAKSLLPKASHKLELINNWSNNRAAFASGAFVCSELLKKDLAMNVIESEQDPIVAQIYPGLEQTNNSYVISEYFRKQVTSKQMDSLAVMTYLELKHRLPELLLMRADKMAMAHSVESRVPFLDHKLVEYALQVDQRLKYNNGVTKHILKKACESVLSKEIIYRKKMGFAAPVVRWFKEGTYFTNHLTELLHSNSSAELVNTKCIKNMMQQTKDGSYNFAYQLWAIQNVLAANG